MNSWQFPFSNHSEASQNLKRKLFPDRNIHIWKIKSDINTIKLNSTSNKYFLFTGKRHFLQFHLPYLCRLFTTCNFAYGTTELKRIFNQFVSNNWLLGGMRDLKGWEMTTLFSVKNCLFIFFLMHLQHAFAEFFLFKVFFSYTCSVRK